MQHETAIMAQHLSVSYGNHKAIDDLRMSVPKRGITALLGSNGAGKTTFIKAALGLIKHYSGKIDVLGQQVGSQALKRQIGVMMQDADLPDLLTPREHLTLVSSYYPNGVDVNALIDQCNLNDFADQRYKKLSGGQKRRVQFACAVAGQPKLVFLDEPTTGLDIQARRVLWQTIRHLSDNGTTVLLTTHYLEEADALADHTIVIDQGRTIAQGSAQDVRNLSQGALVRCKTTCCTEAVQQFAEVSTVTVVGRLLEITTRDQSQTVTKLLALDPGLTDLTVSSNSLETALEQLINSTEKGVK